MLMFAARNEHIQNKIMPALAQGNWVLSDRFSDASYPFLIYVYFYLMRLLHK
jgi:dTMP kinase